MFVGLLYRLLASYQDFIAFLGEEFLAFVFLLQESAVFVAGTRVVAVDEDVFLACIVVVVGKGVIQRPTEELLLPWLHL